jgi:hypothetical protein
MGMTSVGCGRVRWIRLLVIVLALTASRNIFPLTAWAWSPGANTSQAILSKGKNRHHKKYEEAVPSRRYLESRRLDQDLFTRADSESPLLFFFRFGESPDAVPSGRRPCHGQILNLSLRSDPPEDFLRSSHISSLPPPV